MKSVAKEVKKSTSYLKIDPRSLVTAFIFEVGLHVDDRDVDLEVGIG